MDIKLPDGAVKHFDAPAISHLVIDAKASRSGAAESSNIPSLIAVG
jgi:hypothetical protein